MVEKNGAKLPQFSRRKWWLYDVWIIVWLLPVKQWTWNLFLHCEKCMETSDALMQMPVIYFWVLSTFIFFPFEILGSNSDEGVCLFRKAEWQTFPNVTDNFLKKLHLLFRLLNMNIGIWQHKLWLHTEPNSWVQWDWTHDFTHDLSDFSWKSICGGRLNGSFYHFRLNIMKDRLISVHMTTCYVYHS